MVKILISTKHLAKYTDCFFIRKILCICKYLLVISHEIITGDNLHSFNKGNFKQPAY